MIYPRDSARFRAFSLFVIIRRLENSHLNLRKIMQDDLNHVVDEMRGNQQVVCILYLINRSKYL